MQIFLPPKEAQGKVRKSQEGLRLIILRFRVHRDPLDHLSVKLNIPSVCWYLLSFHGDEAAFLHQYAQLGIKYLQGI